MSRRGVSCELRELRALKAGEDRPRPGPDVSCTKAPLRAGQEHDICVVPGPGNGVRRLGTTFHHEYVRAQSPAIHSTEAFALEDNLAEVVLPTEPRLSVSPCRKRTDLVPSTSTFRRLDSVVDELGVRCEAAREPGRVAGVQRPRAPSKQLGDGHSFPGAGYAHSGPGE